MRPSRTRYALRCAIAGGALFYALRLSAGDRQTIDWVVIGVISLMLVWSLVGLARSFGRG